MADYFTQFSCMFDVGTVENAERALEIRQEHADALEKSEGIDLGFECEHEPIHGSGALWIHSGEYGEPENVIAFVIACAEAFDLQGRWGFTWALTCSKPRLDAFGGGAQAIDLTRRTSIGWTDCDHWLAGMLDPTITPDDAAAAD